MGIIVTLILVGVLLLLAEILVVPGFGITGILGAIALFGASYYAFFMFGGTTGWIVLSISLVIIAVLLFFVLRAKTWKRVSLETEIDARVNVIDEAHVEVGKIGKTDTRLAPYGTASFGLKKFEVKSIEGMIDQQTEVEVVLIEDGIIHVKRVQPSKKSK